MPDTNDFALPRPNHLFRGILSAPKILYRMGMGRLMPPLFMLLTMPGRKSGRLYTTPLECRADGDVIWAISGFGKNSDWYRNVKAQPLVTLQHHGETFAARATFINDPEERIAIVEHFRQTLGSQLFDQAFGRLYGLPPGTSDAERQAAYARAYPIRFDRLHDQRPPYPGQAVDLQWVWGVAAVAYWLGWRSGRRSK